MANKKDFPVDNVRHFLEPGPVVLISSHWQDKTDIMTVGWHTVMAFSPSLVGCVIAADNYSFELIKKSKECVINLPTTVLANAVAKIGNTSGEEMDKFDAFDLTPVKANRVNAPLIDECHANFECRLYDDALVDSYNFFIFEVVKAHALARPAHPETLHYMGDGVFMESGKIINKKRFFTKVS